MTDHEKQLQQMQDMLQGAINQRNAAQNECLQLSANLHTAGRENEILRAEVQALTKKLADATGDDIAPGSTSKANGHAQEMSAA